MKGVLAVKEYTFYYTIILKVNRILRDLAHTNMKAIANIRITNVIYY